MLITPFLFRFLLYLLRLIEILDVSHYNDEATVNRECFSADIGFSVTVVTVDEIIF